MPKSVNWLDQIGLGNVAKGNENLGCKRNVGSSPASCHSDFGRGLPLHSGGSQHECHILGEQLMV